MTSATTPPAGSPTPGELQATWRLVDEATARLLTDAGGLSDADCRAPSLLPGWSRAHLLTHVARNADALGRLLAGARTGEPTPMYASAEDRDAEIEAGAGRGADELVADLRASAARLQEAAEALGDSPAWQAVQEWRRGRRRPAADIPRARLAEVELHHVDAGTGYALGDVPEPVAEALVDEALGRLSALPDLAPFALRVEGGGPVRHLGADPATDPELPAVTGTQVALLGWLTGRADTSALRFDGPVPQLPAWA